MAIKDLRAKSSDELKALVAEKRTELVEKRRSLASGELANPRSIKNIRREIATALTLLKEHESAAKEEK